MLAPDMSRCYWRTLNYDGTQPFAVGYVVPPVCSAHGSPREYVPPTIP